MPIHGLFPIPIGTYDLEPLTEEQHSWIVTQPTGPNIANRISKDKYLLDADIMAPIRAQIEMYLIHYFMESVTESNSVGLRITQSWCNFTGPGEAHHKHHHANSIISGVYYPQTTAEDRISFYNSRLERGAFSVAAPTDRDNLFNSRAWGFSTPQNSLILFPSDMEHEVSKRMETDVPDRVSVSFNTFFTGELGTYDSATHLTLP